jgi:predicted neuraminidase
VFEKQLIFPPDARWPSNHAVSVIVLPDGDLLASWFAGTREGAPDAAIWSSRCDGSWSEPGLVADTQGKPDGNSVLWLDGEGRLRVWYVTMMGRGWASCVVRERVSPDYGETWGPERMIREEWGLIVRNEPIEWNGRILMPMYDERDWSAFVGVSSDGGDTWEESAPVRANVGLIQPALAPLSDGRLLMFLRSRGGAIYRSYSADGFEWTEPEATDLPNPNSAVELIGLASGALLCVYNPTSKGRSPLRVALSGDEGGTWDTWRDLESEPGEFSYPTAAQSADGVIHVLYTYRRETIAHAMFDEDWLNQTGSPATINQRAIPLPSAD